MPPNIPGAPLFCPMQLQVCLPGVNLTYALGSYAVGFTRYVKAEVKRGGREARVILRSRGPFLCNTWHAAALFYGMPREIMKTDLRNCVEGFMRDGEAEVNRGGGDGGR